MAGKTISFNTNIYDSHSEAVAKWLSCNGEVWGVGPTAVFASAAALFLYNELEATVFIPGDQVNVSVLEKTLVSTMMLGMLALMVHLWVCSMRFFQYYLDTVIRDSPSMLLEMTTVGLLGGQPEIVPLGPLTRFLRQQQPQIHITLCWFLSLCYADYVRKHYCHRFNLPYLEQWQTELQDRVVRLSRETVERVNCYVALIQQRLRGYGHNDELNRQNMNNRTTTNTTDTKFSDEQYEEEDMIVPNYDTYFSGIRYVLLIVWTIYFIESEYSLSESATSKTCPTCAGTSASDLGGTTVATDGLQIRVVGQSSESTVDAMEKLRKCIQKEVVKETGSSRITTEPTAPRATFDHGSTDTKPPDNRTSATALASVGPPSTKPPDKAAIKLLIPEGTK